MKIKIVIIIFMFAFLQVNCVYKRISRVDCLYVMDLNKEDRTFPEMSFNLGEHCDSNSLPKSSKIIKIVVDHDKNSYEYYATQKLTDDFFKIPPQNRREYDKKYNVHYYGGFNTSGCWKIDKIEFLEDKLPFTINSIDYGNYGWGGKIIKLNQIKDTGIVHIRVLSEKDTIYSVMVITKDSIYVKPSCNVKGKTSRSICISPFFWMSVWFKWRFYQF